MGAVALTITEPAVVERRGHRRVKARLAGRFMRSDRREFDCATIDLFPGGIAFASEAEVQPGERIVAYLTQVGRLEGNVVRTFPGGFAIQMKLPPKKRDRLADQLTWLANRDELGLPEDRRHERLVPRNARTTLKFANGQELSAGVIDMSMSGAALAIDAQPAIGANVLVGATPARVVRIIDEGIAVEFERPLLAQDFSENIVL